MKFGGIQKTSLIDYPGKLCCVVFLSGCNFTCPYCHNPELARGTLAGPDYLTESWFFDFIDARKGFLEGVVISGGEPTLQEALPDFCRNIKSMGYAVKLDTNGSRPGVIRQLIQASLVDYIAMDIKTDPNTYAPAICRQADSESVLASIGLIMDSSIDYEFRTTCVRPLVDRNTIEKISWLIKGSKRYTLQPFHAADILDPGFFTDTNPAYPPWEMQGFKSIAQPRVCTCVVRGETI